MSTRQYARLVDKWISAINLDPGNFPFQTSHIYLPFLASFPFLIWTKSNSKQASI